ncbi:MAG TPA: hypothetical protein VGF60_09630 [Xanthobacteraceae bacterium]
MSTPGYDRAEMAEEHNGPDNLVLRYLRSIDAKLGRLQEDVTDLKSRVTSLEAAFAIVTAQTAGISSRLDRVESRLDRIERRLGLLEAAPS